MSKLRPGDVLSFSSGFQQRGPHGYRVLRKGGPGPMATIAARWPGALAPFAGRVPMVINCYPANIGDFSFGVVVDSYLSGSVVARALMLAALEGMPAMVLGQPLFVADALFRHLRRGLDLPDTLLFGVGGYVMPRSLEAALVEACREKARSVAVIQGYGVAEIDASLLLSGERDAGGQPVYYPRDPSVHVAIGDDGGLSLGLLDEHGALATELFATGDRARREGDGLIVTNAEKRVHPAVLAMLESWSPADWRRRTGYLKYGAQVRFQLRRDVKRESPQELDHWDYGKLFAFSWTWKPHWGAGEDLRATVATLQGPRSQGG